MEDAQAVDRRVFPKIADFVLINFYNHLPIFMFQNKVNLLIASTAFATLLFPPTSMVGAPGSSYCGFDTLFRSGVDRCNVDLGILWTIWFALAVIAFWHNYAAIKSKLTTYINERENHEVHLARIAADAAVRAAEVEKLL